VPTYGYFNVDDLQKLLSDQTNNNSFTILHANIRSLRKNIGKLEELISQMPINPDIIAVSETWLNTLRLAHKQLPGYSCNYYSKRLLKKEGGADW